MKIKSPLRYYPFSLIQGVQGFLQSSVFIWSVSSCIGNIFLISRIIKIEACFTGELSAVGIKRMHDNVQRHF